MKNFKLTFLFFILTSFDIQLGNAVEPVKQYGYISLHGLVRNEYYTLAGVTISLNTDYDSSTIFSNSDGEINFKLQLQRKYKITFTKEGYLPKQLEFNTVTPKAKRDVIFEYEFNVTMTPDTGVNFPILNTVSIIAYNNVYENFVHVPKKEDSELK